MTPDQQAANDALVACSSKAAQLFPALSADENEELEAKMGELKESNWRVGEDGHFVLEVPSVAANRTSSFLFTCAGSVQRRTIDFIDLEGVTKRPAKGEIWSF